MWNKIVQWWSKPFATFLDAMVFVVLSCGFLLSIAALLGEACAKDTAQEKAYLQEAEKMDVEHAAHPLLHYYKDTRTDLCFAGYITSYGEFRGTSVPCTPAVEAVAKVFVSRD